MVNGTGNFGISPFIILGKVQSLFKFFRESFCQSGVLVGIGIGPIIKVNKLQGVLGTILVNNFLLNVEGLVFYIQGGGEFIGMLGYGKTIDG
jgi:hypothetical protein